MSAGVDIELLLFSNMQADIRPKRKMATLWAATFMKRL